MSGVRIHDMFTAVGWLAYMCSVPLTLRVWLCKCANIDAAEGVCMQNYIGAMRDAYITIMNRKIQVAILHIGLSIQTEVCILCYLSSHAIITRYCKNASWEKG